MRLAFAVAVLVPLTGILVSPALAQEAAMPPMMHPPMTGTMLDVVAEGHSARTPDLATIQAGVVTVAATATEALSQNAAQISRVLAAVRKAGVADRDVQTTAISVSPQYRYQQNEPPVMTGYQASNQVIIRFRDVGKAGAILDTLVREGANSISGPNLSVSQPDAAMDEARTDAIAKARARAELYARAAGLHVERIVSISEGGQGGPMAPVYARMSLASEPTPIAAGEQQLSIAVSVRFLLK